MHQLNRAVNLLSQALGAVSNSLPNDKSANEAKGHIKKAMQKIEVANQNQAQKQIKKQTLHDKWWGNIHSNVGRGPTSAKATMKSLEELNKMIEIEQLKIDQPKIETPSLFKD